VMEAAIYRNQTKRTARELRLQKVA
jgi:hypothetical protein